MRAPIFPWEEIMPLSRGQRAAIGRAITRYGEASQEYAFRGTIPAGESEMAAAAYNAVEDEYALARRRLEALIERYVG
jgi:hypothetical protein